MSLGSPSIMWSTDISKVLSEIDGETGRRFNPMCCVVLNNAAISQGS